MVQAYFQFQKASLVATLYSAPQGPFPSKNFDKTAKRLMLRL